MHSYSLRKVFVRVAQEKPKTDHCAEGVGPAMPTVADPQAASRWGVTSPQSGPRYSGATGRFLMVFLCNSTLLVFSVTQGSKKAEKRVPVTCVCWRQSVFHSGLHTRPAVFRQCSCAQGEKGGQLSLWRQTWRWPFPEQRCPLTRPAGHD